VTAFVDTNIIVRHLTGDPPEQAERATRYLDEADELLLPDLIFAEVAYVLASYYEIPRSSLVQMLRALLEFEAVRVVDSDLLQRTIELFETHPIDFADGYLIASAESTGVGVVASFDRDIDRVDTVTREEPT
jgi:predicted nucleic acid-binding protein